MKIDKFMNTHKRKKKKKERGNLKYSYDDINHVTEVQYVLL